MTQPEGNAPPPSPPEWATRACNELRTKYRDDIFEITPAQAVAHAGEWRLKCEDCPGKLYNIGPEQSLNNFEVHLKNRAHRSKVTLRKAGGQSEAVSSEIPVTLKWP